LGPKDIPGSKLEITGVSRNSLSLRLTGEGAEAVLDPEEYTQLVELAPKKYTVRIAITDEMVEDSKFSLIEYQTKTAGYQAAKKIDSLILAAIDEGAEAAGNVVTGGASITMENLAEAQRLLSINDYVATDLIVDPEVAKDLKLLDELEDASKAGTDEMIRKGMIGTIYGMKVWESNNMKTPKSALVIDRNFACVLGEKRPLTIKQVEDKIRGTAGFVASMRVDAKALRNEACAKITTT